EFDSGLHVERCFLPAHLAFIVLKSCVEAERKEAAAGQFAATDMVQIIRRAMADYERHVRRGTFVWLVEGRADSAECDEFGMSLRRRYDGRRYCSRYDHHEGQTLNAFHGIVLLGGHRPPLQWVRIIAIGNRR